MKDKQNRFVVWLAGGLSYYWLRGQTLIASSWMGKWTSKISNLHCQIDFQSIWTFRLEKSTDTESFEKSLSEMDSRVHSWFELRRPRDCDSGKLGLLGSADPRREGLGSGGINKRLCWRKNRSTHNPRGGVNGVTLGYLNVLYSLSLFYCLILL